MSDRNLPTPIKTVSTSEHTGSERSNPSTCPFPAAPPFPAPVADPELAGAPDVVPPLALEALAPVVDEGAAAADPVAGEEAALPPLPVPVELAPVAPFPLAVTPVVVVPFAAVPLVAVPAVAVPAVGLPAEEVPVEELEALLPALEVDEPGLVFVEHAPAFERTVSTSDTS